MDRDLDPALEDAARRRLTALAAAIAVPPATAPPGVAGDPALPKPRREPRRPLLLAGVGAVGAVAVAAAVGAAVLTGRDDGDSQVTTSPGIGVPCDPKVADDGIVASGTLPDGGRWEVQVHGEPPLVTTVALIDGAVVGRTDGDERSRAPVVDRGYFGIHAERTERGTVVWGEVPLTADHVAVRADDETTVACPTIVPADDLVGYFGVALPPGLEMDETGIAVEAVDLQGRVLASGTLDRTTLREVPMGSHSHMTVDPSLVPLPLDAGPPGLPVVVEISTGDRPNGRS
jgi:hypothetical protein